MSASLPIASTSDTSPIACTLGDEAYANRVAWIAALNQSALRSHEHEGRTLRLAYAPSASAQVHQLVTQERECCAFLSFRIEETPTAVQLRIDAPAHAEDTYDVLFAPFLVGASAASGPAHSAGASAPREDSGTRERAPGIAAGTAAVAALACGVCCVLPFALPAVALATVGGLVATLARVFWWSLGIAIVAVPAAWARVGWQSAQTGRRPATSTLRAMIAATLLLGAAVSWPYVEPFVRRALKTS